MSFANDTRLYYGISSVDDGTILQNNLNSVYDNNISFNVQKFQYIKYVLVPILHYLVTYTQILVLI